MPELPEVEQFRQVLLPLISKTHPLRLSLLLNVKPPRVWISQEEIQSLGGDHYCTNVLRKGKQLCLELRQRQRRLSKSKSDKSKSNEQEQFEDNPQYLFLHMGMTGSITSPGVPMGWGHEGTMVEDATAADDDDDKKEEEEPFPPKYAYLILQTNDYKAAFCDSRKFGKCELRSDLSPFDALAPDAWSGSASPIISNVANQSLGIKALLLDQKRACAGVGNWIADEILYQCNMHPDQNFLTQKEATELVTLLQTILGTAVDCLKNHKPYPNTWLFPYRWTKKKAGKDGNGCSITFLQSGGRTSAIIAGKQKLYKRKRSSSSSSTQESEEVETAAKSKTNKRFRKEAAKNEASDEKGTMDKGLDRTETPRKQPRSRSKKVKEEVDSATSSSSSSNDHGPRRRRSPRLVSP